MSEDNKSCMEPEKTGTKGIHMRRDSHQDQGLDLQAGTRLQSLPVERKKQKLMCSIRDSFGPCEPESGPREMYFKVWALTAQTSYYLQNLPFKYIIKFLTL